MALEDPVDDPQIAGSLATACEVKTKPDSLERFLTPGHLIFLADPIGAREPMSVLRELVCEVLKRQIPLTVVLPISSSQQRSLNVFLSGSGATADQTTLLASDFWIREWQDGRSSLAMFEFLEYARYLRAQGAALTVLAGESNRPGNLRQEQVAASILKHRLSHPERLVIGLLGNVLLSKKLGVPWDSTLIPVGARLARAFPSQTHVLDSAFQPGAHWTCRLASPGQLACGTWAATPGPSQVSFETGGSAFSMFPKTSADGFDGLYRLGTLHVSLPAVERLRVDRGRPELERAAP
jgi:hypothetical protein